MSTRLDHILVFLLACGSVWPDTCKVQSAELAPNLKSIIAAWELRESLVRTLTIEWSADREYAEGVRGKDFGPQGVSFNIPVVRLQMSGNELRYETEQIDLAQRSSGLNGGGTYISTFDSKTSMAFNSASRDNEFPVGIIHAQSQYNDIDNLNFRVPLLAFRALIPEVVGTDCRLYTIAESQPILDGQDMVALETTVGAEVAQITRALWVDPARDFVVTRFQEFSAGKLYADLVIQYDVDQEVGWKPRGWLLSFWRPDGSLRDTCNAVVTNCEINSDIPSSNFRLTYPEGTWVEDYRTNQTYVVTSGGKRIVTQKELARQPSYKEIIATESGQAGLADLEGPPLTRRLAIAVTLVAISVIALILYRRRLKTARSLPDKGSARCPSE